MKKLALACCAGLMALVSANAQEFNHFTADIGGGFTTPVGGTGRYTDVGYNVKGGVGWNFSPYVGAKLNAGYNSFGINSSTLGNVGIPGGGVHIFSATIDPVLHLMPKRKVDFYVTGGGGLYHMNQDFTTPTVVTTGAFVPGFGVYPVSFGANQIVSSYTVTKPGVDMGAGMTFGAFGKGKFFAEAKYEHIFMTYGHVDYVPVTFGFRW